MQSLPVTTTLEGSACTLLRLKRQTRQRRNFGDIRCTTKSPVKARRIPQRRKCNWFVQVSRISGQRGRECREQQRSLKTFLQDKQSRNSSMLWNREEKTFQQDIWCTGPTLRATIHQSHTWCTTSTQQQNTFQRDKYRKAPCQSRRTGLQGKRACMQMRRLATRSRRGTSNTC